MEKYIFKPYSKIFPELFSKEKARILAQSQKAMLIEHVGSTAVPDLGGKGIIDLAIAVLKQDMHAVSQELQNLGYEFRQNFSTEERFYFVGFLPDPEEGTRRYHVHLTYRETEAWKDLIVFRDYLRTHPKEAGEYAQLKKQAAESANGDGVEYRKLKDPMIQKILQQEE